MGSIVNEEFCKSFTGDYCPRFKKHVPRSWCFARCDRTKEFPGLAEMVVNFAKEAAKYVAAGCPKRTEAEIEAIKAICDACDDFNKEKQRCRNCGCRMRCKIPWETTCCPKGKWGKSKT